MPFGKNPTAMLLLLLAAPALLAAGSDGSAPFTITISGPTQPVAVGAEVRVHVVLTNISRETLCIQRSPSPGVAEFYYTVRVWDEHGTEAKITDYGRTAKAQQNQGSQSLKLLRPGDEDEEDSVVSKQFDMTAPGQYKIQFEKVLSHDPGNGSVLAAKRPHDPKDSIVKSNEITVTVAAQ